MGIPLHGHSTSLSFGWYKPVILLVMCVCEQHVDGHYVKSNPHSSSHMSNFLTVLSPRHILMEEQIRSVTEISSKKSGANKSSSVIK